MAENNDAKLTVVTKLDFIDKFERVVIKVGFPVVVAAYFLLKDYLFTEKLVQLQTEISQTLKLLTSRMYGP